MVRPQESPPEYFWGIEYEAILLGLIRLYGWSGCFAQTDIFSWPFSLVPDSLDGTTFMFCFQIPFFVAN